MQKILIEHTNAIQWSTRMQINFNEHVNANISIEHANAFNLGRERISTEYVNAIPSEFCTSARTWYAVQGSARRDTGGSCNVNPM